MTALDTTRAAATAGGAPPALWKRLLEQAWKFDCLQAIWLLERYCGGAVPVGGRGPVARENLRFRPDLSLGFPPTDLRRAIQCRQPDTDAVYYILEVAFLGLYGVSTPLPLHYAVDILRAAGRDAGDQVGDRPEAGSAGSSPVRDLLDVLHHRLISLFYRAWLKYHYERMFGAPQRDVITEYLRLLIGCPPGYDEDVLGVSPIRLLRYAGLLTQRPKSATMLEGMLTDYWGDVPVCVEQFVGQWVALDTPDLNRCGLASCGLGVDLTVGEQVYDLGGAFRVCIGPVGWDTYLSFVPGGWRYRQTRDLTRLYCQDPLAVTFQLKVRAGEVPEMQLTSDANASSLGLTSWVRTAEMGETSVTFVAGADAGLPQLASVAADSEEEL